MSIFGGAIAGIIIAWSGMINNATGTATPIAGFLVMFGFNSLTKVIIYGYGDYRNYCGIVGSIVFKSTPLLLKANVRTGHNDITEYTMMSAKTRRFEN